MNAAPQRQDVDVSPSSSSEPASMLVGVYSFDLARQIGLDGSAFISQVHYWLQRSKNFRIEDGCRWIWNTVNQWLEQFSWMSRRKLERVIAKLESLGILLSQKFWKHQWNHTKWYRLDYKKLQKDYNWVPTDKLQEKPHQSSATVPRVTLQTEPAKLAETPTSECGNRLRQNDGFIYRDYIQEITSKENTPPTLQEVREEGANDFEKEGPEKEPEAGGKQESLALLSAQPEPCYKPEASGQDQVFRPRVVCEVPKLQSRDVVTGARELLSNLVFVQWWVNRVERSSEFAKGLVKTPLAFVKGQIRNKPELRADMWESFQLEQTNRVENVNFRQQNGLSITPSEYEEVCAIAPYSAIVLQPITTRLVAGSDLTPEERQRVRQEDAERTRIGQEAKEQLANRFKPSRSSRLLTEEQFQERKKEALRLFNQQIIEHQPPLTTGASTNQTTDYNEADYLGTPDPSDFERHE